MAEQASTKCATCPPPSPLFQIRLQDYTGAGRALTRGTPPPNQKGGKCEAQHLWLSLAKLAFLAGGGGAGGGGGLGGDEDLARGAEIQRRLDLAEVRDRLVKFLPAEEVVRGTGSGNVPFCWVNGGGESASGAEMGVGCWWVGGGAE